MNVKNFGLPGSVAVIGLIYVIALAITPTPGHSAQTPESSSLEAESANANKGFAKPPMAVPVSHAPSGAG